eukprot:scaffold34663_cov205-Amphora_coffeaeformis.AAC.7
MAKQQGTRAPPKSSSALPKKAPIAPVAAVKPDDKKAKQAGHNEHGHKVRPLDKHAHQSLRQTKKSKADKEAEELMVMETKKHMAHDAEVAERKRLAAEERKKLAAEEKKRMEEYAKLHPEKAQKAAEAKKKVLDKKMIHKAAKSWSDDEDDDEHKKGRPGKDEKRSLSAPPKPAVKPDTRKMAAK